MNAMTPGRALSDFTISTAIAIPSCSASAALFKRSQDFLRERDARYAGDPFGLIGRTKDEYARDDGRLTLTTDAPELGKPLAVVARSKTGCVWRSLRPR